MRIIAICGKTRSGKDTVAKYIEFKYKYQHKKISDCLKKGVSELFGFSYTQLENNDKDKIDPIFNITPRDAMNFIGTHVFQYEIQKLLPDSNRCFWIDRLLRSLDNDASIVISDLRFLHEVEKLSNHDLTIIRIDRSNTIDQTNYYKSELLDIEEDLRIDNNSTLNQLYMNVQYELDTIYLNKTV